MKAEVDKMKCDTSGRCVIICPEVFQFSTGDKKAKVIRNPVPPEYQQKVLEAHRECPMNAIILGE